MNKDTQWNWELKWKNKKMSLSWKRTQEDLSSWKRPGHSQSAGLLCLTSRGNQPPWCKQVPTSSPRSSSFKLLTQDKTSLSSQLMLQVRVGEDQLTCPHLQNLGSRFPAFHISCSAVKLGFPDFHTSCSALKLYVARDFSGLEVVMARHRITLLISE